MRVVSKFAGKNREFRRWLKAQRPANVVSLAEYKRKKAIIQNRPGAA